MWAPAPAAIIRPEPAATHPVARIVSGIPSSPRFASLRQTGSMPRRVAMVTGASSGIGAVFARRLSRDGFALILVARRADRLESLARELGGAETIAADLTKEGGLARVEQRIASCGELELLINNAGFGTKGKFWETPLEEQDAMHRLHVIAT